MIHQSITLLKLHQDTTDPATSHVSLVRTNELVKYEMYRFKPFTILSFNTFTETPTYTVER